VTYVVDVGVKNRHLQETNKDEGWDARNRGTTQGLAAFKNRPEVASHFHNFNYGHWVIR